MLDIKITRTAAPKAKPEDESKLGFGKIFTDHMFVMNYTAGQGWHDARIVPYAPFQLDPATTVLHYAQEIFEGMKAYRTADGTIQLFRPDCNAKRMQDSADRLCIPPIPEEDYIQAVKAIVDVDRDWVPHSDGASLYIRPFAFASDVGLGVHAAKEYIFCIICSPSGAYYAEGINPVRKIRVEKHPVHIQIKLNDPDLSLSRNYDIIHGQITDSFSCHSLDHHPLFNIRRSRKKAVQCLSEILQFNICQESQRSKIDSQQREIAVSKIPYRADQSPVSAEHQGAVCFFRDRSRKNMPLFVLL